MLKLEFIAASEKNTELKSQIRELTEKIRLAEQGKDNAQKEVIMFDGNFELVARTGGNHAVSGSKFHILREFLQMGYGVLLSDVDIVYLQNPFEHLYRDSDVQSMTDGHNNMTAYGYDDIFDEPTMGWARYAHTMRIWVYNSGFFYIRPTIPSIELLDRVAGRLAREMLGTKRFLPRSFFYPSHPGYDGFHASRRTMDYYLFMNSKVLFKTVRRDTKLSQLKPVIVHSENGGSCRLLCEHDERCFGSFT
ncbi:hypothetical protein OROGR_009921 [Orobanche gracilis]